MSLFGRWSEIPTNQVPDLLDVQEFCLGPAHIQAGFGDGAFGGEGTVGGGFDLTLPPTLGAEVGRHSRSGDVWEEPAVGGSRRRRFSAGFCRTL